MAAIKSITGVHSPGRSEASPVLHPSSILYPETVCFAASHALILVRETVQAKQFYGSLLEPVTIEVHLELVNPELVQPVLFDLSVAGGLSVLLSRCGP